jgi:hypothetical protein
MCLIEKGMRKVGENRKFTTIELFSNRKFKLKTLSKSRFCPLKIYDQQKKITTEMEPKDVILSQNNQS